MGLQLWDVFICVMETLCYTYLFYKTLGNNQQYKMKVMAFFGFFTILSIVFTQLGTPYPIKAFTFFISYPVMTRFCFQGTGHRIHTAFWSITPVGIAAMADYISYFTATCLMGVALESLSSNPNIWMVLSLIYLLMVFLLVVACCQFKERTHTIPLWIHGVLFVLVLLGIVTAQVMIEIAIVIDGMAMAQPYAQVLLGIGYGLLLLLFGFLIGFEYLGATLVKNRELRIKSQLTQMDAQRQQLLVSAAQSLSAWKHDYLGQLKVLHGLAQQNHVAEMQAYTRDMLRELTLTDTLLSTGNSTIDTVVSLRMSAARQQNIPFKVQIHLPETLPISDVIASVLIGNILDNAMESCEKQEQHTQGISLEIKPWKQMLSIYCTNESNGIYRTSKRNQLLSTKAEAGHGLGIQRIHDLVEQTGGMFEYNAGHTEFSVNILLPMEGSIH